MDVLLSAIAAFASAFDQANRPFSLPFSDALLDTKLLPHMVTGKEYVFAPFQLTSNAYEYQ